MEIISGITAAWRVYKIFYCNLSFCNLNAGDEVLRFKNVTHIYLHDVLLLYKITRSLNFYFSTFISIFSPL